MSLAVKLLPLLLLLLQHQVNSAVSDSTESRLVSDLLKSYNSQIRPVRKHKTAINVTFGLAVISAQIDKDGVLQMVAWERTFWNDEYLVWNSSLYDNITSLRIDESKVWIPDITLYNKLQSTEKVQTQVVVDSTGSVIFVPQIRFYSQCNRFGSGMYSFNRYECTMRFGSWVHSADSVNLTLSEGKGIDFSEFISNRNWIVESSEAKIFSVTYPCCPETYQSAIFTIGLRRTSAQPHSLSAMISAALLLPFSFLLSRNQGLRVGMTIALLLGFTSSAALAQITIGQLGSGYDKYFCGSLIVMILCLLLHLLPRYNCKFFDRLNKGIGKNNESGEVLQESSSNSRSSSSSSSSKSKLNLILDLVFFIVSLIISLLLLLMLRNA